MKRYNGDELLRRLEESGLSQRKFAKSIGMNFNSLHSAVLRAKKRAERAEDGFVEPSSPPKERLEFQDDGNRATAASVSKRIMTVEDLIEACKIDLEVWEIERSVVNKWEGYRSGKTTNLEYADGLATGQIEDSGRLWIEPLFQVKLWLVKRAPTALRPVVQPVEIKLGRGLPRAARKNGLVKKALGIADPHIGFMRMFDGEMVPLHDERALKVIEKLAQMERFDVICLAGDVLDLAEWTDKYVRTPEHYWTTQAAVNRAAEFIGLLKQTCEEMVVIEGNHDERFEKLMVGHFMHAYDLRPADRLEEEPSMSVPNLLGLERMGVEYVGDYPNGIYMLNERVGFVHGDVVSQMPGLTASKVVQKSMISKGFGHIHRREMASRRIPELGYSVSAFCPGGLCRIDGVVPGSKKEANWQQGYAVVEYEEGGEHAVGLYPIEEGRSIYRGVVTRGDNEMG